MVINFYKLGIILQLSILAFCMCYFSPSIADAMTTGPNNKTIVNVSSTLTTTPIKHLVIIFQENISFDHYFATYPYAKNSQGNNSFLPKSDTPSVNGLTNVLLNNNTNLVNPFKMGNKDIKTVASFATNHTYTAIQ